MRQSYNKEQHKIAKAKQMPLVCIGWNGQYQSEKTKQTEALFWGPVSPEIFEKIRILFVEIAEDGRRRKRPSKFRVQSRLASKGVLQSLTKERANYAS